MRRIGLALGGGAARGLAHLGVLEALLDAGIRPAVIAGTSFGSLVGAATCCAGGDAARVRRAVVQMVSSEQFRRSRIGYLRRSQGSARDAASFSVREAIHHGLAHASSPPESQVLPLAELEAGIDALVPDVAVESLSVAFGAVAADLVSGEEVLFDRGSLRLAVKASCAIPGLLPPVRAGGRVCVDGGWVEKVPVHAARELGADVVIAVDVADELADTSGMLDGAAILHRADAVREARFRALLLASADVVVRCDVARYGWADFGRVEEIADAGRSAALEALSRVREAVGRPRGLLRLREALGAGRRPFVTRASAEP